MSELNMQQLLECKPQISRIDIEGKMVKGEKEPPIIGHVFVREFSAHDRRSLIMTIAGDETRAPAAYIMYGVCDSDGKRKFVEDIENGVTKETLIESIMKMQDLVVAQMFAAVSKINTYDERAIAKN